MISVLLVDQALENPPSIRKLLSSSRDDFKLNYASSYREILEGFRSKTYDVCVVDSSLDNGLKLFAQARSLGCTAPLVMITSNDAREVIRATRSGVADCLIRDDLSAAGLEHSLCFVVEQARSTSLQNQRERRYLALLGYEVELVTKYGYNLMVEISTHPINHDGRTIEIQSIATTPASLHLDGPWKTRSLTAQRQPAAALEEHEVLFLHTYEAANRLLLQDNSPSSGATSFSL